MEIPNHMQSRASMVVKGTCEERDVMFETALTSSMNVLN